MRTRAVAVAVVFALVSLAHGSPRILTYQGNLVEPGGVNPVSDGTYDMRFSIYDVVSGGSALWTETDAAVQLTNGLFTTVLGDGTVFSSMFFPWHYDLWLEVEIDVDASGVFELDELFSPRQRLTAAPWAMDSDRLNGRDASAFAEASHSHSLDESYDDGGAGLGRTITADSGPVEIIGADGLIVEKQIHVSDGSTATVSMDATPYGRLWMSNGSSVTVALAARGLASSGGALWLANSSGTLTSILQADLNAFDDYGAAFVLADGTRQTILLDAHSKPLVGPGDGGAEIHLANSQGQTTIKLDADQNNDSFLLLTDANGTDSIRLHSDSAGSAGELSMYDASGDETVEILAAETSLTGAQILLRKADGTATIEIDADYNGDGRIITEELAITGGSDLSEQFDIRATAGKVEPGMAVSIDPERPGKLVVSSKPYDRTVAGIISGAGGLEPGMMMGQKDSQADGAHPVALTGRVYCWCDASHGPIEPGDLLTTSATPGHAMKVTDHSRSQGAVLGKAMTSLPEGKGLVLVLVALH